MSKSYDTSLSSYRELVRSHYAPNEEHCDIAREAYEKAIVFIEEELQSKTNARTWVFANAASMDDLCSIVEQAKSRYDASTSRRKDILKNLHRFSSRMIYYSQALDVLAQHHPEYVALVWGAMKFIFIGIINHQHLVSQFSQALASIGDALRTAKLGAELFQTDAMKNAVGQLYAHVILFFQAALRWYNRSPAGRAFSSIFKPYELQYQDTAEQIKNCAQAVNDIANSASRAEVRDVNITIQLMRRDSDRREKKLLEMQAQLQETQQMQLNMEKSVDHMLQVMTSHRAVTDRIDINVQDMAPRVRDIQFSQILQSLQPAVCPDLALEKVRSIYDRSRATRLPEFEQQHISHRLEEWFTSTSSSIFLLRVGLGAERKAKELAADVISLLRSKSHNVVWRITPVDPALKPACASTSELYRALIHQILQLDPSVMCDIKDMSVAKFGVAHSEAEWITLLQMLFQRLSKCFVVLETHDLFQAHHGDESWTSRFLRTLYSFANIAAQNGNAIKLMVLCYGSKTAVASEASTGLHQVQATLKRPVITPASRKHTVMHQRQRQGWRRCNPKI